jgi:uncharacterized protein YwgA
MEPKRACLANGGDIMTAKGQHTTPWQQRRTRFYIGLTGEQYLKLCNLGKTPEEAVEAGLYAMDGGENTFEEAEDRISKLTSIVDAVTKQRDLIAEEAKDERKSNVRLEMVEKQLRDAILILKEQNAALEKENDALRLQVGAITGE